jgi:hypothetical protein
VQALPVPVEGLIISDALIFRGSIVIVNNVRTTVRDTSKYASFRSSRISRGALGLSAEGRVNTALAPDVAARIKRHGFNAARSAASVMSPSTVVLGACGPQTALGRTAGMGELPVLRQIF